MKAWPITLMVLLGIAALVLGTFGPDVHGKSPEIPATSWLSPDTKEIPTFKVQLLPQSKKVSLQFLKEVANQSPAIGMTFYDETGAPTTVELRAMDPHGVLPRYEGDVGKLGSFVGFEVKIPFGGKSQVIHSRQMRSVGNLHSLGK